MSARYPPRPSPVAEAARPAPHCQELLAGGHLRAGEGEHGGSVRGEKALGPAERCAACKTAIPHWHPYQLRHNATTRLVQQFGWDVARMGAPWKA